MKPGKHFFSYAIIADTHVNHKENQSASPFECSRLANPRSRHVVADLNRRKPDFVIHLGDLVNPVPHLPAFPAAAERFRTIFRELDCPLYLVPGNHDVGDKKLDWTPAGPVCKSYLEQYRKHFGRDYYSFDHKGAHFVCINAQLIGSGLKAEREHRRWLEKDVGKNSGKRIFLHSHYPPYVSLRGESDNYDNLGEPGRSWLLDLCGRHRVEAVFGGHVHNFFYDRFRDTELYVLPSTSFVRQDYSELFRVAADNEFGRNDTGKFGYFFVRVYERGHAVHFIRTYGGVPASGRGMRFSSESVRTFHSREEHAAPVGLNLRKSWAEVQEIPASGAVDEFERKFVRNDYTLMAVWETGARKLRIPLHDLANGGVLPRIRQLRRMGHEFIAYCCGVPEGACREVLRKHHRLLDVLEIVVRWDRPAELIAALKRLKKEVPVDMLLSRLRGFTDKDSGSNRFLHFVDYGLEAGERAEAEALLNRRGAADWVDGFVFRIPRNTPPWKGILEAHRIRRNLGKRILVMVDYASRNLAETFTDDRENANRTAEAVAAGYACDSVDVILDAFVDVDRGYFIRTGLYDRLYNPRPAGRVFRFLSAALNAYAGTLRKGEAEEKKDGRWLHLTLKGARAHLFMPAAGRRLASLPEKVARKPSEQFTLTDLVTGGATRIREKDRRRNAVGLLESGHPLLFLRLSP